MALTDEELIAGFASGDEEAFNELVGRYRGPLFTVVLRMVGNMAEAQDIFQETFLRVIDNLDRFDRDRRFSSWVYAIATNLARDRLRRQKARPSVSADSAPESAFASDTDPEKDSWRSEVVGALQEAIGRLPADQREVFVLREYSGLSFKEIAEVTGTKLNTVLGRMHLAVKKLRVDLAAFVEE